MESTFVALCLYLVSILVYLAIVLVFVKPYYRNIILLEDGVHIDENRSLTNSNAALLDTFMYKNYYCYGFIYPLFIIIKILKAIWFLIVGNDMSKNESPTIKDNDFKPHHW